MHAELQTNVAFHVAGRKAGEAPGTLEGLGLRPALLAAYGDLTRLRYDFPLVLRANTSDERVFEPLSGLIDRVLEDLARAGNDADRLRAYALRLERELRAMAASGATGALAALVGDAERRLGVAATDAFGKNLGRLRAALEKADGEVVDCSVAMPARLLTHAWRAVQQKKAGAFRKNVDRLIQKLADILRADHARSESGRSPASLKASVGTLHGEAFDFEAMSRFLATVSVKGTLSDSRRGRIASTLATLKAQRFYAAPGAEALGFQFDSCASALQAFRERVPDLIRLAKAITVAELEIEGEFSALRHDALFDKLAASGLDLRDLALFPDYLVCVGVNDVRALEQDALLEILAGGLPMKILVQSDDILEEPLRGTGHAAVGARSRKFASMAIGMNDVYVVQSSSSHLVRLRERILKAMRYSGPALISVFSGANGHSGALPPYLVAAAAMESRAFPSFTYDPAAGPDWASRFALDCNPQAERDWPLHRLAYEDAEHQRVVAEVAFTLVDFVACDLRYAGDFAKVPRANWSGALVPAAECVDRQTKGVPDKLPSLLMVDGENLLHKVIVDDRLVREAHRCREMWHQLQELGGIHNSHAERLLARERKNWEEARQSEVRAPTAAVEVPAAPAAAPAAAPVTPAEAEKERPSDEPYIETPRCSSCDECTQINNKMFAYDANKQARIVDPSAGTYRQLVEAAESCQVAIIHPGKPKNPTESGLEDLLKRAEAFL
jgi:hypothetical protein